jgi:hypothetical protein
MHKPVRQLLEAFLGKLPAGAANISEGVDDSANKYLEVHPRNPLAARIRVLDEDSGEYLLGIGRGTIIEVALAPAKRSRFRPASAEEIFLDVCSAVAKGEFEEKVSGILAKICLFTGESMSMAARYDLFQEYRWFRTGRR